MAQLLIRNLPDEVKEGLRERARANGRSMEAEARAILIDIVERPANLTVEYDGPIDIDDELRRLGVKLMPKVPGGRVVTNEDVRALMDELMI